MRIAYHFTIPRPPLPELDAAIQDALRLQTRFPGELNFLYPVKKASRLVPRFLCGLHQWSNLAILDRQVDLHHLYSNEFYPYPILNRLQKPIVYTIVASLKEGRCPLLYRLWNSMERIFRFVRKADLIFVTSNERDGQILSRWGVKQPVVVPPGIDLTKFSYSQESGEYSVTSKFVLLAGSAPWSLAQFKTKGVELLLEAVQAIPNLHLILLWRGVLFEEIQRRVQQQNLADRVEIINHHVEVNQLLARVHATVVLSKSPYLIKAYPHSLLESLGAGKPIIISDGLAMSDYVKKTACGEVVSEFTLTDFVAKLEHLRQNYLAYQQTVRQLDLQQFSIENLVNSYGEIYEVARTRYMRD